MIRTIAHTLLAVLLVGAAAQSPARADQCKIRKANEDTREWRYDIDAQAVGSAGTYLIKVWSYSKRAHIAQEQSKKNAVHGILFKGFPGKQGIPGQRPLVSDPATADQKAEYFERFFADGGPYMRFVEFATDGNVAAGDRVKIKREYKIGIVVSVNVAALRKQLEADRIVKALGAGF